MPAGFPKGRTALLVIHGIGEQNPLETLDSFSRGFIRRFTEQALAFRVTHEIVERKESAGSSWTESFVRLQPDQGEGLLDIHEYYWAYLTEEKITVPEVWAWVEQTLAGTRKFYADNQELRKRYEKGGKPAFRLEKVHRLLYALSIVYPVLKILVPVLLYFFKLARFKKVPELLERMLRPLVVGYLGDVAIYTTTDAKSRFFDIRRKILTESHKLVESLLAGDTYDRVIIAGHSLGSAIAYDTLNRLNLSANLPIAPQSVPLEKIGGLITFGSPLDKIAFFFRERASKNEYVRRQILQQLHSFKAKELTFEKDDTEIACNIKPKLDGIRWVNYHDPQDPVSGHLDFYLIDDDDNRKLDMKVAWGKAHTAYWEYDPMYEHIIGTFFQDTRPAKADSARI